MLSAARTACASSRRGSVALPLLRARVLISASRFGVTLAPQALALGSIALLLLESTPSVLSAPTRVRDAVETLQVVDRGPAAGLDSRIVMRHVTGRRGRAAARVAGDVVVVPGADAAVFRAGPIVGPRDRQGALASAL